MRPPPGVREFGTNLGSILRIAGLARTSATSVGAGACPLCMKRSTAVMEPVHAGASGDKSECAILSMKSCSIPLAS